MLRLLYIKLLFAFILLFVNFSTAQSPKKMVENIKANSTMYLFGEGIGSNTTEADEQALYGLSSQISLSVEGLFESVSEWGKGSDFKENVKTVVKTYSSTTLNNAERIVLNAKNPEDDVTVFRYIKREDVAAVFKRRTEKIQEFVGLANQYNKEHKVSEALRYYYWALLLLKSHPHQGSLKYVKKDQSKQLFSIYIPNKINQLLGGIQINMDRYYTEDNIQKVAATFSHEGNAVQGISYSYWTGIDWTVPMNSPNNKGFFEFSHKTDNVKVKIEYAFKNEARIDNEIEKVMHSVKNVSFDTRARKNVALQNNKPTKVKEITLAVEKEALITTTKSVELQYHKLSTEELKPYLDKMASILVSIKNKNFQNLKQYTTQNGMEVSEKLLKYGNAYVMKYDSLSAYKKDNSVIIHSIPIRFSFRSNRQKFIENVVFHFNDNLLLDDLTFSVGYKTQQDILKQKSWSEINRLTIIDFLERYKTAYALKRLDYISSIFSNDALIIVGKVIKIRKSNNPDFASYSNNKIVKQNKYTKAQFVKHLGYSFRSKEYINLKFEDLTIRRGGAKGNLYGIQIKQYYYSSNYGDEGYLFLMVDLDKPKKPIIHVRTWQPEKNSDGSIYGIGDF